MNEELIHELAIKAGFKKYDGDLYSPYIEGYELNGELEEFAELIVKHCIIELERCTLRNGNSEHNLALYEAMSRIRNKFGMELK